MFACAHGIEPDIVCLSKALTAGYLPLGATVCTERIYEAFLRPDRDKAFLHGHSYTANPLACAVALASLDLFETGRVLDRVVALEALFRERLEPLRALAAVADVRVMALALPSWRCRSTGYRPTSDRHWQPNSSPGTCCCDRSGTWCISCRRTRSPTRRPAGRSTRSWRC
jgi:adenosylmethionine-8-amino-7-oxononanoate aminotransferase